MNKSQFDIFEICYSPKDIKLFYLFFRIVKVKRRRSLSLSMSTEGVYAKRVFLMSFSARYSQHKLPFILSRGSGYILEWSQTNCLHIMIEIDELKTGLWSCIPVSRVYIDPWPFLEIKSRPNNGYRVKEHENLYRNSKNRPFQDKKKVTGV